MGAIQFHPPPPAPPPPGFLHMPAILELLELHGKFDELENKGVFARPESLGITAEYLNPFLSCEEKRRISFGYRVC